MVLPKGATTAPSSCYGYSSLYQDTNENPDEAAFKKFHFDNNKSSSSGWSNENTPPPTPGGGSSASPQQRTPTSSYIDKGGEDKLMSTSQSTIQSQTPKTLMGTMNTNSYLADQHQNHLPHQAQPLLLILKEHHHHKQCQELIPILIDHNLHQPQVPNWKLLQTR